MRKIIFSLWVIILFVSIAGCNFDKKGNRTQQSSIFIGIDVSGSFTRTKSFKDGVGFLSYYLYGHLNAKGNLSKPTDLYVGGIGGNQKEEPQAFFPIHDFAGLSAKKIQKKLMKEFSKQKDNLTDFNTFFQRVKSIVKQKNLVLSPISLVLLTDGVPEIAKGKSKKAIKQAYSKIDLSPLEYLTRNISVRLLYSNPRIGNHWRNYVPTKRIKIWTVEPVVMYGWREQLKRNKPKGLWKWIEDNVDLRIRSRGI